METGGAALAAVSEQVLDEPETDVAGHAAVDRVKLDDRPFVARALTLDARQPGNTAALFVDVEQVGRPEGAKRHAEKAEHADLAAADGQAQRADALTTRVPIGGVRTVRQP